MTSNTYRPRATRPESPVWGDDDYVAGYCNKSDVGRVKPGFAPPWSPTTRSLDPSYDAEDVTEMLEAASAKALNTDDFKRDVLIAYAALGGPRFLMQHPQLMEKLLIKLLGEQKAPSGPATVTVNLSWLSPERLAYRNSGPVVDVAPALAGDQLLRAELGPSG